MLYSEPGQLESTAQYPAFEPDAQRGGKGQGTLEVERFFGELVQREQRAQEEGLAQREREQQDEVSRQNAKSRYRSISFLMLRD